jgi:hypothetical protein
MKSRDSTNPTTSTNAKGELLEAFCQMFRALVRPAVAIIFAAVIAQVVIDRIEIPQWFLGLAIPCITWWFAERTITHVQERKKDR